MADVRYPEQPDLGAEPPTPMTRGPWAILLWGAFLGCSWTWVIGMVLPALLLRDYGIFGWVAFAVPNVLGAAMMGLVLRKPEWSANIVIKHGRACHHFTVATVAYQLYVASWLFGELFGVAAVPMLVVAVGLCATLGLRNPRSAMLFVAVGIAVLSWGCFSWATKSPGAWGLTEWALPSGCGSRLTTYDLILFAPCAFVGFALCPYLDLTFHRARYSTASSTGVWAFFFGFGGVFASMIVFSVCYGALLLPFIRGDEEAQLSGVWLVLLGVHLTLQAGFTITVHVRESMENPDANTQWLAIAAMAAVVLGVIARLGGLPVSHLTGGLTWGEAGYRGFLLLYGTVFPGYVWLVMIPRRGGLSDKGKQVRLAVFAVTAGASYALGWSAFVQGHSVLLIGVLGLFVLARLIIELLPRANR